MYIIMKNMTINSEKKISPKPMFSGYLSQSIVQETGSNELYDCNRVPIFLKISNNSEPITLNSNPQQSTLKSTNRIKLNQNLQSAELILNVNFLLEDILCISADPVAKATMIIIHPVGIMKNSIY